MTDQEYYFDHIPGRKELEQSMKEDILVPFCDCICDTAEPFCRPPLELWEVLKNTGITQITAIITGILSYYLYHRSKKSFCTGYLTANIIFMLFYRKSIVLYAIRLYQHFAPEHIRKKCCLSHLFFLCSTGCIQIWTAERRYYKSEAIFPL